MIFANSENGEKIEATPKAVRFCPSCGEKLSAKCGELKVWHWSHIGRRDCDDWYEPETEWHLGWKRLFGKENCEVVMPPHRADIVGNFDVIIELQHSSISVEEIRKREAFYNKMFWIVDAQPFCENLFFQKNSIKRVDEDGQIAWSSGGGYWWIGNSEFLMVWKSQQKRWLIEFGAEKDVMLDLSNIEVKAGVGFFHGIDKASGKKVEVIKNSLFWIRSLYQSDYVSKSRRLIGGSFVSKQRILERYKPTI